MSRKQLDNFLRLLRASPSGAVFNPWWQIDEENDIGRIAPIIRRQQLRVYVQERLGRAKLWSLAKLSVTAADISVESR